MSLKLPKVFEIIPAIKNYAWGLSTSESWVAKFCDTNIIKAPYAEAWFGAHPSGSSIAKIDNKQIPLNKLISERKKELLSENDINSFAGALPVLPKVLSISRPLSIQLHPDTENAKRLHATDPIRYPDPYPKDEASIALTKVSLLHSLLSFEKIKLASLNTPEIKELLNSATNSIECFKNLLKKDEKEIQELCKKLYSRLKQTAKLNEADKWVLECERMYPKGDKGIFCFYLFNIITLQPGEAISLNTGIPHAYLSGELLEVMKPSDNVIRCGLTPKFIDSKELINCLNKEINEPKILKANKDKDGSLTYNFQSQGFSVKIIDKDCKIDTKGNVNIAVSLDAKGSFSNCTPIEAFKAYCITTQESELDLSIQNGKLALFSFKLTK